MRALVFLFLISSFWLFSFSPRAHAGAVTGPQMRQMVERFHGAKANPANGSTFVVVNEFATNSEACVQEACSKIGCASDSDRQELTQACHGNLGGECLRAACQQGDCTFKADAVAFAQACRNVSGDCVRNTCSRAGCAFKADIMAAIRACRS